MSLRNLRKLRGTHDAAVPEAFFTVLLIHALNNVGLSVMKRWATLYGLPKALRMLHASGYCTEMSGVGRSGAMLPPIASLSVIWPQTIWGRRWRSSHEKRTSSSWSATCTYQEPCIQWQRCNVRVDH